MALHPSLVLSINPMAGGEDSVCSCVFHGTCLHLLDEHVLEPVIKLRLQGYSLKRVFVE